MIERDLWRYFKQGLEQVQVDLQRIETRGTGDGVFDVNAIYQGIEIWVELKHHHSPLRPAQKSWCVRRLHHGGRLWIISTWNDVIQVWNGRDAVVHRFYPRVPNYVFVRPIKWHQLRDTLFGKTNG